MLGSSLLPVVCGRAHVLFTLFVLACVLCCVFLRVVYPVLPDSLDCPFLIVTLVFSYVFLRNNISKCLQRTLTNISNI